MRRPAAGALLLSWLTLAAGGAGGDEPPAMPPQHLEGWQAGELHAEGLTRVLGARGVPVGFLFRTPGWAYAGAYLRDARTGTYDEVGAWRGELVGPCPTFDACATGMEALTRSATLAWRERSATSAETATEAAAPASPSAAPEASTESPPDEAPPPVAADAPPATPAPVPLPTSPPVARPAAPPQSAPAPPPHQTSLWDLVLVLGGLRAAHPVVSWFALAGSVVVWWSLRRVRRAERRERHVVITHEEHERAAAELEARLREERARLLRLSDAAERDDAALVRRIAELASRGGPRG